MKHPHCELIKAWADGATIEIENPEGWQELRNPSFYTNRNYRIKPSPMKYRVALHQDIARLCTISIDKEEEQEIVEKSSTFIRWISNWVEYEE